MMDSDSDKVAWQEAIRKKWESPYAYLPEDLAERLGEIGSRGEKLPAIKLLRVLRPGIGLWEAKHEIEACMRLYVRLTAWH